MPFIGYFPGCLPFLLFLGESSTIIAVSIESSLLLLYTVGCLHFQTNEDVVFVSREFLFFPRMRELQMKKTC